MIEYKCFRCGYEASQKIGLVRHLKRKNVCLPKNDDVSIESIINYYGFEQQKKPVFEQVKPVFTKNRQNQAKPGKSKFTTGKNQVKPAFCKNSTIFCDFCGKNFMNFCISKNMKFWENSK